MPVVWFSIAARRCKLHVRSQQLAAEMPAVWFAIAARRCNLHVRSDTKHQAKKDTDTGSECCGKLGLAKILHGISNDQAHWAEALPPRTALSPKTQIPRKLQNAIQKINASLHPQRGTKSYGFVFDLVRAAIGPGAATSKEEDEDNAPTAAFGLALGTNLTGLPPSTVRHRLPTGTLRFRGKQRLSCSALGRSLETFSGAFRPTSCKIL